MFLLSQPAHMKFTDLKDKMCHIRCSELIRTCSNGPVPPPPPPPPHSVCWWWCSVSVTVASWCWGLHVTVWVWQTLLIDSVLTPESRQTHTNESVLLTNVRTQNIQPQLVILSRVDCGSDVLEWQTQRQRLAAANIHNMLTDANCASQW